MAKYTEEQKQKALHLLGPRRQKKVIREVAYQTGIPYSVILNWVRPPLPPLLEQRWIEVCKLAKQNSMVAVKQNNRVFLLNKQDYGLEYDEQEYDLETTTSFPDTVDGLESALSWLDPYRDEEETDER